MELINGHISGKLYHESRRVWFVVYLLSPETVNSIENHFGCCGWHNALDYCQRKFRGHKIMHVIQYVSYLFCTLPFFAHCLFSIIFEIEHVKKAKYVLVNEISSIMFHFHDMDLDRFASLQPTVPSDTFYSDEQPALIDTTDESIYENNYSSGNKRVRPF